MIKKLLVASVAVAALIAAPAMAQQQQTGKPATASKQAKTVHHRAVTNGQASQNQRRTGRRNTGATAAQGNSVDRNAAMIR